jgi:hypothetical protein
MPEPEIFSERKSSSMMMIGKRNFINNPLLFCPIRSELASQYWIARLGDALAAICLLPQLN